MKTREGAALCVQKNPSVTGKQRRAGFGDPSKNFRDFKTVPKAKGELKTERKDPLAHFSGDMSKTNRSPALQGYCHQLLFLMKIAWQIPSISYSLRGAFLLLGQSAGRMAKVCIISITS